MIYPTEVQYLHDYELLITLRNKALFARARIERGTVVWNDELDIAPEALYAESILCTR